MIIKFDKVCLRAIGETEGLSYNQWKEARNKLKVAIKSCPDYVRLIKLANLIKEI